MRRHSHSIRKRFLAFYCMNEILMYLSKNIFSLFKSKKHITVEMYNELFVKHYEIALCSVDGENWYDISEISALCSINNHYAGRNLDAVLEHYNKGHIVPVEYVLYKKKTRSQN